MEELKILIKLSDKLKPQNEDPTFTKVMELEQVIRKNFEKDENFIKNQIFPKTDNKNYFGVLKNRLYQELYNKILIDSGRKENINNRLNQLFDIQRRFIVASLLQEKNERSVSIKMYEKLFKQCEKWDYTPYKYLISRVLYSHFAYVEPNRYKMQVYKEEFEKSEILFIKENRIYSINAEISHMYQMNRSGMVQKNLEILKVLMVDVIKIHEEFDSYTIKLFAYDLIAYYYLTIREYNKVIKISEEGIQYFSSKTPPDVRGIVSNNINIINANIYKGALDKALNVINESYLYLTSGSRIWVRLKSFEFVIYTLQNKYDNLYHVYKETNPKVKLEIDKEEWLIRSAYIHFLIRMGKIELPPGDKKQDSFVLTKFLNSVPFYSKDKSGLNISIIIVQILFYFLDKKWDKVLDKIDGLKQYSFRYLTKDESMRSSCFIKMLIAAEKAHFNRQLTITYTKSLYEKMVKSPYVLSENSAFVEIVPYETLWEITLELLIQPKKR